VKTQNKELGMHKKLIGFFLARDMVHLHNLLTIQEKTMQKMKRDVIKKKQNIEVTNSDLTVDLKAREKWTNLAVEEDSIEMFVNRVRQNNIVNLCSLFELWILRDCLIHAKNNNNGKKLISSRNVSGLYKIKKYFVEVKNSKYDFSSQNWKWIKGLFLLRNCIIHRQGSLSGLSNFEVNTELVIFVENEKYLHIPDKRSNIIEIDYAFCNKALFLVQQTMADILELSEEK
jgi:hypothetical protein